MPRHMLSTLRGFNWTTCYAMKIIFFFVLLSGYAAIIEGTSSGCYPCNQLNRRWTMKICDNSTNDCGDCFHMFVNKSDSKEGLKCQLPSYISLKSNQVAVVPRGSNVILECQYGVLLDCAWLKRYHEASVGERHFYLQNHGPGSTGCSVIIFNFQEIDTGLWKCNVFDKSYSVDINIFKDSWVYIYDPTFLTVQHDGHEWIPFGETVVLSCFFFTEVNCSWKKDYITQDFTSMSNYIPRYKSGIGTKDCSLRIQNFQAEDAGKWECCDKVHVGLSQEFYLYEKMVDRPKDQLVELEGIAALPCRFNFLATCIWTLNGRRVRIEGRYLYKNPVKESSYVDCSFYIAFMEHEDLGLWKCEHEPTQTSDEIISYSAYLIVSNNGEDVITISKQFIASIVLFSLAAVCVLLIAVGLLLKFLSPERIPKRSNICPVCCTSDATQPDNISYSQQQEFVDIDLNKDNNDTSTPFTQTPYKSQPWSPRDG